MFAAFAVGFVIFLLVACDAGTSPNASPTPTPSSIEEMQQQWKKEDAKWKERQKEPLPPASAEDRAMIEAELAAEKSRSKLSMSVDALARAYNANEIAADEKYKGKAVIITGKIQSIGKDILGSPFVVVGGSGMLDGVQCMFAKSATSSLASLSKGRTVTISGTVSGKMLTWVMMSDCQLQ